MAEENISQEFRLTEICMHVIHACYTEHLLIFTSTGSFRLLGVFQFLLLLL